MEIVNKNLQEELLRTLSFLEEMNTTQIFMDLDINFVNSNPELNYQDLSRALVLLQKSGKVQASKVNGELRWKKVFPKKNLLQKLAYKIKNLFF